MDMVLIFWMVLLILCIVIEILTLGLTTIWFAAGALVAIFAALLYAPIFVQVILFLLVSLTLLFFTRPIAVKYFNRDRVKTNVESMVGRQAIVIGEIDNIQATGQVTVSGQEWSARSWDDKVKIPVGAVVVVAAISGVKLIVKMEQQFANQSRASQEPYEPENAVPTESRAAVKDETLVPEAVGEGAAERKAGNEDAAEYKARNDGSTEYKVGNDGAAERKAEDDDSAEHKAGNDGAAERKAEDDDSAEHKAGNDAAEQKAIDDGAAEHKAEDDGETEGKAAEEVSSRWMVTDDDAAERKTLEDGSAE